MQVKTFTVRSMGKTCTKHSAQYKKNIEPTHCLLLPLFGITKVKVLISVIVAEKEKMEREKREA